MQGSKIKARETYATDLGGKLVRFYVDTVTVVKKGDHAADQTTTVTGRYLDNDGNRAEAATLRADALLGPYTQYTELVAKEQAEKEERERKTQAEKEEHERLWRRFYELTGHPLPVGKKNRWGDIEYDRKEDVFRRSYSGGGFDITKEGADALIAALERVQRLKAVG